jgi:hypothetical protein
MGMRISNTKHSVPKDAYTDARSVLDASGRYVRGRAREDQGVDLRGKPHETTIPIDVGEHLIKVGDT